VDLATGENSTYISTLPSSPNGLLVQGDRLYIASWGVMSDRPEERAQWITKTAGDLYWVSLKDSTKSRHIIVPELGNLDGVEIDQNTGKVIIDKYVTTHDAGTLLHPEIVNGQIQGAFAQAVGASLYEEFKYADNGEFLSGTFADYLVPTVNEIPEACILHISTPSPFTPLGSKGVGEGNSMSTPVCIANAISDAIEQDKITLPMTPPKLWGLISKKEDLPKNLNLEITDEKKKISVELYQNYTNKKFWKYIKNKLRNIV